MRPLLMIRWVCAVCWQSRLQARPLWLALPLLALLSACAVTSDQLNFGEPTATLQETAQLASTDLNFPTPQPTNQLLIPTVALTATPPDEPTVAALSNAAPAAVVSETPAPTATALMIVGRSGRPIATMGPDALTAISILTIEAISATLVVTVTPTAETVSADSLAPPRVQPSRIGGESAEVSLDIIIEPPTSRGLNQPVGPTGSIKVASDLMPPTTPSSLLPTNRSSFARLLTISHANMRGLSETIHRANWEGALRCDAVVGYYNVFVEQFVDHRVAAEFELAFDEHRNAVDIARRGIGPLANACRGFQDSSSETETVVTSWDIQPQAIWQTAYTQATNAMRTMDVAMEWLAGNPSQMAGLFSSTRLAIARYGTQINNAAVKHCPGITATYNEVVYDSPVLSPAEGANSQSYRYYRDAVESITTGGRAMIQFCEESAGMPPLTPIPDAASSAAIDGYNAALQSLSLAGASLAGQAPIRGGSDNAGSSSAGNTWTPPVVVPTPDLVRATLVRVQPGERSHLYEVVLRVEVLAGQPPYTVVVGGFPLAADGTITIIHTCERDFRDRVTIRDAAGAIYKSNMVSAERAESCQ